LPESPCEGHLQSVATPYRRSAGDHSGATPAGHGDNEVQKASSIHRRWRSCCLRRRFHAHGWRQGACAPKGSRAPRSGAGGGRGRLTLRRVVAQRGDLQTGRLARGGPAQGGQRDQESGQSEVLCRATDAAGLSPAAHEAGPVPWFPPAPDGALSTVGGASPGPATRCAVALRCRPREPEAGRHPPGGGALPSARGRHRRRSLPGQSHRLRLRDPSARPANAGAEDWAGRAAVARTT